MNQRRSHPSTQTNFVCCWDSTWPNQPTLAVKFLDLTQSVDQPNPRSRLIWTKVWICVALCPHSHRSGPHFACEGWPIIVPAYTLNFVLIGLFCCLRGKKSYHYHFRLYNCGLVLLYANCTRLWRWWWLYWYGSQSAGLVTNKVQCKLQKKEK